MQNDKEVIFPCRQSGLDNWGAGIIPYKLKISQNENTLLIEKKIILEYAEYEIRNDTIALDGREIKSTLMKSPMLTTSKYSESGSSLLIESKVKFSNGENVSEMLINEIWSLKSGGQILSIKQSSSSMWGDRNITMIFEKLLID